MAGTLVASISPLPSTMTQEIPVSATCIRPNTAGLPPFYNAAHFKQRDRLNKLMQIVSGESMGNGTRINQDTNIFISEMKAGRQLGENQLPGRQMVLACLEGSLGINNLSLERGDAIKVWNESAFTLTAMQDCHLVMVDMPGIQ